MQLRMHKRTHTPTHSTAVSALQRDGSRENKESQSRAKEQIKIKSNQVDAKQYGVTDTSTRVVGSSGGADKTHII